MHPIFLVCDVVREVLDALPDRETRLQFGLACKTLWDLTQPYLWKNSLIPLSRLLPILPSDMDVTEFDPLVQPRALTHSEWAKLWSYTGVIRFLEVNERKVGQRCLLSILATFPLDDAPNILALLPNLRSILATSPNRSSRLFSFLRHLNIRRHHPNNLQLVSSLLRQPLESIFIQDIDSEGVAPVEDILSTWISNGRNHAASLRELRLVPRLDHHNAPIWTAMCFSRFVNLRLMYVEASGWDGEQNRELVRMLSELARLQNLHIVIQGQPGMLPVPTTREAFPSLEILLLTGEAEVQVDSIVDFLISVHSSSLRELTVEYVSQPNDYLELVDCIARKWSHSLVDLHVSSIPVVDIPPELFQRLKYLPELELLALDSRWKLCIDFYSDRRFDVLSELPKLRTLWLPGTFDASIHEANNTIAHLKRECPKLQRLYIPLYDRTSLPPNPNDPVDDMWSSRLYLVKKVVPNPEGTDWLPFWCQLLRTCDPTIGQVSWTTLEQAFYEARR